jgi:hypothetical protein
LKISDEFLARLENRGSKEMVRAVVMLEAERTLKPAGRRALRTQRKKLTAAAQRLVEGAETDIAKILEKYGGHRLESNLGALGSLAVETTPAGIKALIECPCVRAILEDQPISLISK